MGKDYVKDVVIGSQSSNKRSENLVYQTPTCRDKLLFNKKQDSVLQQYVDCAIQHAKFTLVMCCVSHAVVCLYLCDTKLSQSIYTNHSNVHLSNFNIWFWSQILIDFSFSYTVCQIFVKLAVLRGGEKDCMPMLWFICIIMKGEVGYLTSNK